MTTPTLEPTLPTSAPTIPPVTLHSPAEVVPTAPKPHELKDVPWPQVVMSTVGLVCWILLYSAGLLMESVEERILLAPHTMEKQLGPNGKDLIVAVTKRARDAESLPAQNNSTTPPPTTPTPTTPAAATPPATSAMNPAVKTEAAKEVLLSSHQPTSRTVAFFYSALVYTPTNMALLTLFAGLLGGCVSNIKYSMMTKEERENLKPQEDAILSENPLSATMRGFVIYLCMVAGLYVVLDDPFKDSSPGQYARLAGSMSLVAFIVGFDPTRIKVWLRMVDKSSSDAGNSSSGTTTK